MRKEEYAHLLFSSPYTYTHPLLTLERKWSKKNEICIVGENKKRGNSLLLPHFCSVRYALSLAVAVTVVVVMVVTVVAVMIMMVVMIIVATVVIVSTCERFLCC
jgi:Flp pilus assembly protein TadB